MGVVGTAVGGEVVGVLRPTRHPPLYHYCVPRELLHAACCVLLQVAIAQGHLLPRQLQLCALPPHALRLQPATIAALAEGYTREAGVRNLERQIGALCRHVAVRAAQRAEGGGAISEGGGAISEGGGAISAGGGAISRCELERGRGRHRGGRSAHPNPHPSPSPNPNPKPNPKPNA